jgi:LysM repeat protein
MAVSYTIRRGDSLSALAGRYLGNPNKWRDIFDFHNEQVKLRGPGNKALFAIKKPDLIYVGQVVVIPGRGERLKGKPAPVAAVGNPAKPAAPVDLKTTYYIGPPKNPSPTLTPTPTPTPTPTATPAPNPPAGRGGGAFAVPLDLKSENTAFQAIRYKPVVTPDFTMISELSGEITLENLSPDRHRSNWELATTDDQNELSYKLRQSHDKAFMELTSGMGMAFDPVTRKAILRPSIAAKAGAGPYEVELKADGPNHFSSTLKLETLQGEWAQQGRNFKFTASVVIKVDVTMHPTPKGKPEDIGDPVGVDSKLKSTTKDIEFIEKVFKMVDVACEKAQIVAIIVISIAMAAQVAAASPKLMQPGADPATVGPLYWHTIYLDGKLNA